MFGVNGKCQVRDITDGTSNTVAVAESLMQNVGHDWKAWSTVGWSTAGASIADAARPLNERRPYSWTNAGNPPFSYPPKGANFLSDGGFLGSMHTGGLHILLGDGSVRFLSDNTDFTTRANLARIADGNVLGEY